MLNCLWDHEGELNILGFTPVKKTDEISFADWCAAFGAQVEKHFGHGEKGECPDYLPEDWEIAHQRISQERFRRTGRLTLANLEIDELPSAVLELDWLTNLDCCRSNIKIYPDLGSLKKLETFDCSYSSLTNLPSLEGCSALHTLWCGVSEIKSLESLRYCPTIQTVYCGRSNVVDISPLLDCPELVNFYCDQTKITSLDGIQNCKSLGTIGCHDTKISSVMELSKLPKLKGIILNGCHLSDPCKEVWSSTRLEYLYMYRGTIKGVPAEKLSRSYEDNCLFRLRSYLEQ